MKTISALALTLAIFASTTTALGYGEDCDLAAGVTCDDGYACRFGVCACSNMEYSFDVSQGRCIGVAGSPCSVDTNCGALMECQKLFCACIDGYSPTLEWQCKKGYEAVCTTSNDCNRDAQLQCTSDRKCRCDESTHVYDSATKLCRAKVGHACDPYIDPNGFPNGESGHRCVPGGRCERNKSSPGHFCTCDEGFELTDSKECKAIEEGGNGGGGASGISAGVAFILGSAVLAMRM